MSHLEYIESKISVNLLAQFKEHYKSNRFWSGSKEDLKLFLLWKEVVTDFSNKESEGSVSGEIEIPMNDSIDSSMNVDDCDWGVDTSYDGDIRIIPLENFDFENSEITVSALQPSNLNDNCRNGKINFYSE